MGLLSAAVFFNHNVALEPFCPSKAHPVKLVPGLCSQNPCLLPILPPSVQLD